MAPDTIRAGRVAPAVRRWLWFIGLWAAGVVSVVSVAAALRWVLLGRL